MAVAAGDARARPRNAPQRCPRRLPPLPSPPPGYRLALPPPPARSRGSVTSLYPLHPTPNPTLGEPTVCSAARAHTRTFQTSLLFGDPLQGVRESLAVPGARHWGHWGLQLGIPLPISLFPPDPGAHSLPVLRPYALEASFTHPFSRFSLLRAPRAGGPETFSFRSPPFV